MLTNTNFVLITLFFIFFFVLIGGLFNYFFAKAIAKWFKRVQIIDKRRNLDDHPKLAEIIDSVEKICLHYRIPQPEIGFYPAQEINAFATGRPNNSMIAFSTSLINNFTVDEIKGVVAHELSHLINKDFMWMLIVQGFFDLIFITLNTLLYWVIMSKSEENSEENSFGKKLLTYLVYYMIYSFISSILKVLTILPVLWFNRKRELKADRKAAEIIGTDKMILTLKKLLSLENQEWIVDNFDLTGNSKFRESDKKANDQNQEPSSVSILKFNPDKKKSSWIMEIFRTHPRLEERISRLEELKRKKEIF